MRAEALRSALVTPTREPHNFLDGEASYSIRNYKRVEMEFVPLVFFHRRVRVGVARRLARRHTGGFYGLGTDTSKTIEQTFVQTPLLSGLFTRGPHGETCCCAWVE